MKSQLLFVVWLLPASPFKNRLLTLLGHPVHPTALARPNVVWKVAVVSMGPESRIGRLNLIKNMNLVQVGESASIGRLNVFSSHPLFAQHYSGGAAMVMGAKSYVTSRHQLDCSGGVNLGTLAAIAGHQSRVMTHSIDIERNAQAAYPVWIGERTFVGARCLVLGGATLPPRSVLAAGSVLPRSEEGGESGLYAGTPAKFKMRLEGAWFDRSERETWGIYMPESDSVVGDGS